MTQKKSNGQDAPKMEVKKQEQTQVPAVSKAAENGNEKPSYEELLKRLEQLEKERLKKPANIEEVINYYEQKKRKISQLNEFKTHSGNLNEALTISKELNEKGDFDEPKHTLVFSNYNRYGNSDPIFKISNPALISDCLNFVLMRLNAKIMQLEAEIQSDF